MSDFLIRYLVFSKYCWVSICWLCSLLNFQIIQKFKHDNNKASINTFEVFGGKNSQLAEQRFYEVILVYLSPGFYRWVNNSMTLFIHNFSKYLFILEIFRYMFRLTPYSYGCLRSIASPSAAWAACPVTWPGPLSQLFPLVNFPGLAFSSSKWANQIFPYKPSVIESGPVLQVD